MAAPIARTPNADAHVCGVRVQDSVFAVYNAGYELAMRCR
jgi:hypothetical protein